MPFDAVLEVIIEGYPDNNGINPERGDFVTALPAAQVGDVQPDGLYLPKNLPVPMKRTGWVFIRDIPNTLSRVRVRKALLSSETSIVFDPAIKVKDRRFSIPVATIPAVVRQAMLDNRYINVTFDQAKSYVKYKIQDRLIVDSDF